MQIVYTLMWIVNSNIKILVTFAIKLFRLPHFQNDILTTTKTII